MIYKQDTDTGLWFEWNGAHTVNVQHEAGGQDVDCYSIGDFAQDAATLQEFEASVDEYLREQVVDA
jgi:hypothetical protein